MLFILSNFFPLQYLREAFVGQTVRILGSLDVVGNPSGVLDALIKTVSSVQAGCVAALTGDGMGTVEAVSGTFRNVVQTFLVPIVGLSNASSRVAGTHNGLLKAILDANQSTVTFVYDLVAEQNEVKGI